MQQDGMPETNAYLGRWLLLHAYSRVRVRTRGGDCRNCSRADFAATRHCACARARPCPECIIVGSGFVIRAVIGVGVTCGRRRRAAARSGLQSKLASRLADLEDYITYNGLAKNTPDISYLAHGLTYKHPQTD